MHPTLEKTRAAIQAVLDDFASEFTDASRDPAQPYPEDSTVDIKVNFKRGYATAVKKNAEYNGMTIDRMLTHPDIYFNCRVDIGGQYAENCAQLLQDALAQAGMTVSNDILGKDDNRLFFYFTAEPDRMNAYLNRLHENARQLFVFQDILQPVFAAQRQLQTLQADEPHHRGISTTFWEKNNKAKLGISVATRDPKLIEKAQAMGLHIQHDPSMHVTVITMVCASPKEDMSTCEAFIRAVLESAEGEKHTSRSFSERYRDESTRKHLRR